MDKEEDMYVHPNTFTNISTAVGGWSDLLAALELGSFGIDDVSITCCDATSI